MIKVAIFDDVVAIRGETFHIPGLEVDVHDHADQAVRLCRERAYDVVCMDYAMGADHQSGEQAIAALRQSGFGGRIIAISSDPNANLAMQRAGADECLAKKAHLRSFLVAIGTDPTVHADGTSGPSHPEPGGPSDPNGPSGPDDPSGPT